jgi:YgiT-type zinc finger domain-containing protein
MLSPEDPCPNCNGKIEIQKGPGRKMAYRGQEGYIIPDDVSIAVCSSCGADWMDNEMINRLGTALEDQRITRILESKILC